MFSVLVCASVSVALFSFSSRLDVLIPLSSQKYYFWFSVGLVYGHGLLLFMYHGKFRSLSTMENGLAGHSSSRSHPLLQVILAFKVFIDK